MLYRNFVFVFSCYMNITAIFHFPFRLNCYNILDISGCFCGIPLSQFESNVSQWKFAMVSNNLTLTYTDTCIHDIHMYIYTCTYAKLGLSQKALLLTFPFNFLIIAGVTDPKSKKVTEHQLLDLRLNLNESTVLDVNKNVKN